MITGKQLIVTEILDTFFDRLAERRPKKDFCKFKKTFATDIAHWLNSIRGVRECREHAKIHLKNLGRDRLRLVEAKTHRSATLQIAELIDLEIKIERQFISLSRKEYFLDLFFILLDSSFREVRYERRVETIACLYWLLNHPLPESYHKWKETLPDSFEKTLDSTRKRLHRISHRFKNHFQKKGWLEFEKTRLSWLPRLTQKDKNNWRIIDRTLTTKSGIKKSLRHSFIQSLLVKEIARLTPAKIAEQLNIPDAKKMLATILRDDEFRAIFSFAPAEWPMSSHPTQK